MVTLRFFELPTVSEYFSKGKIDASGASQWMLPVLERRDAVKNEVLLTGSTPRCCHRFQGAL